MVPTLTSLKWLISCLETCSAASVLNEATVASNAAAIMRFSWFCYCCIDDKVCAISVIRNEIIYTLHTSGCLWVGYGLLGPPMGLALTGRRTRRSNLLPADLSLTSVT